MSLKDLPENPKISKDWVHVTLCLFRQHLEHERLKQQYGALNFYCDWIVHSYLDRVYTQKILERISSVLIDPNSGHPSDEIAEILFDGLRADIRAVLQTVNLQAGIFEGYRDWKSFAELMLASLLNKPLKWNGNHVDIFVETFELYEKDGTVFWKMMTMPGQREFTKELMFAQDPREFRHQ